MTRDNSILDEIHAYREAYAKRFNYDWQAIFDDLKQKEAEGRALGRVYVSPRPKSIKPIPSEPTNGPIRGLRTVVYHVADLNAAKSWYANALAIAPYFDEPYYVGFRVGGCELGLDPDGTPGNGSDNAVAYWGVDNIDVTWKHLLDRGAKPHAEIKDVGGGIRLASVSDPFGNVLGIIENPNDHAGETP